MNTQRNHRVEAWYAALIMLTGLLSLMMSASAGAEVSEQVELCLSCHEDPSLEMEFADKQKMNLNVTADEFSASVHGTKLNCTDCHTGITDYPHPEIQLASKRQFSLSLYDSCKRCHFANYTKALEGIHYKQLSEGDTRAPTCGECHGAHNIHKPDQPRAQISQTCNRCHSEIYDTYKSSIHGKSLLSKNNPDVPVCTDCHRAHDIQDPTTKTFLAQTPELCGQCHANEKLMGKYGLSTNVLKTYWQDFHGVSAHFFEGDNKSAWKAVCTDCHGVHDIKKVTDDTSPVLKANLSVTCRKCHPDAGANFPDAWLSHYDPGPNQASVVYFMKLFYNFFIPFTVVGLLLHILLHIWRVATNR